MGKTADELVTAVSVRAGWPSSNAPLSSAEILAIADEELAGDAYPIVAATHGDYYLARKDYDVVANQRFYRLPDRAYNSITDVCWVDANGLEGPALGAIKLEDIPRAGATQSTSGSPPACVHWIDGDRLGLYPVPSATTTYLLRVKYMQHPSRLALTTSTDVSAIVTDTASWASGSLTIGLPDSTHFFPAINATCDIVSSGNAHATLLSDALITNRVVAVFTIAAATNPTVASTDYFCRPGYTPIVQLPDFMLPYFIRRVAGGCLTAASDRPGADRELQAAAQLLEKAQSAAAPRNKAEPRTVRSRNSALAVRGPGVYWGR